ncbi:MAG: hypothetical protein JWQ02_2123, partial [Capsulimonas sp.]|nr:hypothetical protein [Capsulimonas sp.]
VILPGPSLELKNPARPIVPSDADRAYRSARRQRRIDRTHQRRRPRASRIFVKHNVSDRRARRNPREREIRRIKHPRCRRFRRQRLIRPRRVRPQITEKLVRPITRRIGRLHQRRLHRIGNQIDPARQKRGARGVVNSAHNNEPFPSRDHTRSKEKAPAEARAFPNPYNIFRSVTIKTPAAERRMLHIGVKRIVSGNFQKLAMPLHITPPALLASINELKTSAWEKTFFEKLDIVTAG